MCPRVAVLAPALGAASDEPLHWVRVVSLMSNDDTTLSEVRSYMPYSGMALSRNTGLLAFASPTRLEVFDLQKQYKRTIRGVRSPVDPCWFPDGRHLAFEAELLPKDCPARIPLSDPDCPRAADLDGVDPPGAPEAVVVTCIWDADTGLSRVLQAGGHTVPAPDGLSLLVVWHGHTNRIDATTGELLARNIPVLGKYSYEENVFAQLSRNRVIYGALVTTGGPLEPISNSTSFKWTVKVEDLSTGEFSTVLTGVHHRHVAYSQVHFDLAPKTK